MVMHERAFEQMARDIAAWNKTAHDEMRAEAEEAARMRSSEASEQKFVRTCIGRSERWIYDPSMDDFDAWYEQYKDVDGFDEDSFSPYREQITITQRHFWK